MIRTENAKESANLFVKLQNQFLFLYLHTVSIQLTSIFVFRAWVHYNSFKVENNSQQQANIVQDENCYGWPKNWYPRQIQIITQLTKKKSLNKWSNHDCDLGKAHKYNTANPRITSNMDLYELKKFNKYIC